jgi:hypothetical protein
LVSKMRESEAAVREKFVAGISDETNAFRTAAESIISVSRRWMLVAIAGVYLIGMVSYPVFAGLITWLEKVL